MEHYPDPLCKSLCASIGEKQKINSEWIRCGNGASELFQLLVYAIKPKKAMITAPAFSGYEQALSCLDVKIEYLYLKEETGFFLTEDSLNSIPSDLDMIFICNPNNPVIITGGWVKIFIELQ